jgi:hypothetical protein
MREPMRPFGGAVKDFTCDPTGPYISNFPNYEYPVDIWFSKNEETTFSFSWMFIHADSRISGYGTLHISIVPEQQETEKRVANVHNQEWGFEVVLANGDLTGNTFKWRNERAKK